MRKLSKQSEKLLSYLRSGRDRRSPSFANMLKHSGYANNRALIDGLLMLTRKGALVRIDKDNYQFPSPPIEFYPFGYNKSGGTS